MQTSIQQSSSTTIFQNKDTVVEMGCDLIKNFTDEDLFVAIPEIAQTK